MSILHYYFPLPQVHAIWDAYISALENGLNKVYQLIRLKLLPASSLSRIDSAVDPKLPESLKVKRQLI